MRIRPAVLALAAAVAVLGCASTPPEPDFAEMPSAEELYRDGLELLEGRRTFVLFRTVDWTAVVQTFQDIIDNYPYSDQAVLAELAIADAYFEQGRFEEALSYYRDFPDLHPEHERVPYAIQQAARCHYERSHEANRDQTATREALGQLDRLLSDYPHSPYAAEAEVLWKQLRARLAEHVLEVGDFYLEREEYPSAAERYRALLEEYPGLGFDAQALYKLGTCYTRMNRADEAQRIFQVILDNYGGTDVAEAAADLVPAAQ